METDKFTHKVDMWNSGFGQVWCCVSPVPLAEFLPQPNYWYCTRRYISRQCHPQAIDEASITG